jgi:hypothetical protein
LAANPAACDHPPHGQTPCGPFDVTHYDPRVEPNTSDKTIKGIVVCEGRCVWDFISTAHVCSVLNLNGIIEEGRVMDTTTLPKVKMPNRDGFVADPRPDVR